MQELVGYNSNHMKSRNRGIALQLIAGEKLSRAELTKRMGLSKMAITKIANELMEYGYVVEGSTEETAGAGRNPTQLEISPTAPIALGVYLSRNELSVMLGSLTLETLYRASLPLVDENADTLTEKLFALCDGATAFAASLPCTGILGIGVSAIGPVDPEGGRLLHPTNFFGISDYPIGRLLGERYGLPVFCDNDMNASAVCEKLYGVGRQTDHFIYFGITNGIGAGIISDGKLCRHGSVSCGEIGHMSIRFDGPRCTCGNRGCLEVYANMPVILRKLEVKIGQPVSPADLPALAENPRCEGVFSETLDYLCVALVNAANILDPGCIVIGHEGAFLPDSFLAALGERVNGGILSSGYQSVEVVRSTFGDRAPDLGSVSLVFEMLFSGQLQNEKAE